MKSQTTKNNAFPILGDAKEGDAENIKKLAFWLSATILFILLVLFI